MSKTYAAAHSGIQYFGNWVYDGTRSFSKTKSDKGPYHGMELTGRVTDTFVRGKRVYGNGRILCDAGYGRYIRSEG